MPPYRSFRQSRLGLTLVELITVVVVVAVLCLLLFPVFSGVAAKIHQSQCISNLRQISIASAAYGGENNGNWPRSATGVIAYSVDLQPYLGDYPGRGQSNFRKSPLVCPTIKDDGKPSDSYTYQGIYTPWSYQHPGTGVTIRYGMSYAQNTYASRSGTSLNTVKNRQVVQNASEMMIYMDFQGHYVATLGSFNNAALRAKLNVRHDGRVNVAYVDGSIRAVELDSIPTTMPNLFWQGRASNR